MQESSHFRTISLTLAFSVVAAGYRVDAHQRSHGVVYQAARNDLLDLESLGLLERQKQGNAYLFFAPDDLRGRLENLSK